MKREKLLLWALVVLFAVLMSLPFLVPHCGFFALFGIVPLLCMERIASLTGVRRVWIWHYSAFVLWNAATTFWVCNATVGGGLFAIFANALQMSLIFGLFRLSKKRFTGVLPYIFLMTMWIAWERAYFDAEISWPWLVLGNSFARSIGSVQWYEYTGSLGGSLWVWAANLTLFGLMASLSDGSWQRFNTKAKTAAVAWTVLIIAGPFVASRLIWDRYRSVTDSSATAEQIASGSLGAAVAPAAGADKTPLEVYIFQPNIDPYHKFEALSQSEQDRIILNQMAANLPAPASLPCPGDSSSAEVSAPEERPLLLLMPETFTNHVIVGDYEKCGTWRSFTRFLSDRPGTNILFGASAYSIFSNPQRPSHTARQLNDGRWLESHNAALMVDGTARTEIFLKNKLVVAVEKTPYPALFCKIDDLLGGVMGRNIGQDSISVMHCVSASDTVAVGCAICYESVYGEYYTGYVRKGAEVMTIITNDAWWGNTPGYRQHLSYASLRAIETRREIARCGNTGISCFINQRGEIRDSSPWWEEAVLHGYVNRNDKITFFVTHGDLTGRVCTFVFLLLLLALVARFLLRKA